jgi:hypothetical protein
MVRRMPNVAKWLGAAVATGLTALVGNVILAGGEQAARIVRGPADALHVTAQPANPADYCNGGAGWVFRKKPQELSVPAWSADLPRWAIANGGVPASGNYVVVTLQGIAPHTVIIQDVRVVVVHKEAASGGTYPLLGGSCGVLVPAFFAADLDSRPVRVRPVTGMDATGHSVRPVPLPHQVSESNPEVWDVQAKTERSQDDWIAYVDWLSDGQRGSSEISADGHGRPFRTAATTSSATVSRGANAHTWTAAP